MEQPTPAMRKTARRLLEQSVDDMEGAQDAVDAALRAHARIRVHLAKPLGAAGYDALMSRALALARRDRAELVAVRLDTNGSLTGLEDYARGRTRAGVMEDLEELLARLLWLLTTFIGEDLTLRLIGESWPDAAREGKGAARLSEETGP